MSPILDGPLVIAALRMALGQRRPARALIVHSDRGAQFASAPHSLSVKSMQTQSVESRQSDWASSPGSRHQAEKDG
jgi:putative transposase